MKIYLDNCSIQRPLDDQSQLRIRLEAEAILSLLDLVYSGRVEQVSSDILVYEIRRSPHPTRLEYALATIEFASTHVVLSREVERRAAELEGSGIDPADRLHLASAESGGADYFCTCDDSFARKAKREVEGPMQVVSPLELAKEIEKWQSQQDP